MVPIANTLHAAVLRTFDIAYRPSDAKMKRHDGLLTVEGRSRLAGLAKAFPQHEILVTTWVVVYRSQSLKAALRVKGWSLEGERREKDLPTAASASLVLCCPE